MMDCFNSIIDDIILHLSEDKSLSDIVFLRTYPKSERPSPLDKPYVTVGFLGIDIMKKAFSDYIGELSGSKVCGRQANITLSIKVYSPKRLAGEGCMEVFERVCDSLLFGERKYLIENIECKKIEYDLNLTAINLTGSLKMSTFIKK